MERPSKQLTSSHNWILVSLVRGANAPLTTLAGFLEAIRLGEEMSQSLPKSLVCLDLTYVTLNKVEKR